jgi:cytochrome c-type biogenesis protein CcmF
VSAGRLWRLVARPAAFALVVAAAVIAFADGLDEPAALVMFTFAAFTLGALAQEFARGAGAQRALTGGTRPAALATVVGRNRRRYGGYVVHAGIAILLVAVAASSSFRTSEDVRLEPGESADVGGYRVTYERPTVDSSSAEQRLTFGAVLDVDRDGEQFAVLSPSRNFYSSTAAGPGGPLRSFFEGEATSEVGRRGSAGGDLWTAMRPDLEPFDPVIDRADQRLEAFAERLPQGDPEAMQAFAGAQGQAVLRLAAVYEADPPPADFRVNVNPLVIWLWIGGAIGVAGALLAVWPAPAAKRKRVADVHAARLARDLGRA